MTYRTRIIGFNGTMGVGKSTAINLLREYLDTDKGVKLVKFAGPLYDMQEYIYGRIDGAYRREPSFVKDRKLLQWLGTDWGRETISQNLWVDLWKADVKKALTWNDVVVCDDVRFDNEADTVHSMGGIVIKITSDRALDRITTANGIQNHSSEKGIAPELVDYTVDNSGSLAEFKDSLWQIFCEIYRNNQNAS